MNEVALWKTHIIDDHSDRLYIDTASKNVGGNKNLGFPASELVDDSITLRTFHGATELGNLVAFGDHTLLKFFGGSSCLSM